MTNIISKQLRDGTYFPNCKLKGLWAISNWSQELHALIDKHMARNDTVVWLVSDYKFYNIMYPTLLSLPPNQLLVSTSGQIDVIQKKYCTPTHYEVCGNHTLKVIDAVVQKHPTIKLIFWCLYKRTKANSRSSYPRHLWYDEVVKRYKANVIDIDNFTTPREFNRKLRDESAHPNEDGYALLDTMIRSLTPVSDTHTK